MTFSLIVATLHRIQPLAELLRSLAQTPEAAARRVQVIVSDQNADSRLNEVLATFRNSLSIAHLRSAPGLSRARNAALSGISSDIVAFPDDDCLYERTTLSAVRELFEKCPECHGFSGRVLSLSGRPMNLRWPRHAEVITKRRVWRQALSISLFLRRAVIESVGPFDESLGVGSGTRWGSGEETDYVLRALAAGFNLRFDPSVQLRHPEPADRFEREQRERAYSYALGMGRVLRTHTFPRLDKLKYVLRPALGSLSYAAQGRMSGAKYYAGVAKGRLEGLLSD